MAECQHCGAPSPDQANLCTTHTSELTHLLASLLDTVESVERDHRDAHGRPVTRDLRDRHDVPIPYAPGSEPIRHDKAIPGIVSELETTITRQDRLGITSGAPASGEKPLAWNERAAHVAVELNATINAWGREVDRMRPDQRDPLTPIPWPETHAVAAWLRRHVTDLAYHEDAGQALDEIRDAVGRARGAVDRPKHRTSFFVGPCPEMLGDNLDEHCPGEVHAFIPTSEADPALMRCQYEECGAAWNTTQWLRAGGRILARMKQLRNRGAA